MIAYCKHFVKRRTRMSGKELFGVLVRFTGLLATAYALWTLVGIIEPAPGIERKDYLIGSIPLAGIGVLFLLGAETICQMAYRNEKGIADPEISN
jgi:hypothetical protein